MDQEGAEVEQGTTTPLFAMYRRGGYDPEQVDRFVADQERRLDQAEHRASEAERRLAAAVGQLRELHRRVAVLESEDRSPQPPSLDTLGDRVQRILKEAWEGAYALRQAAEQEVADLRGRAAAEAEEIVGDAEGRARQIDEEIDRRRKAYIARLEEDRSRAVAQVSYLHEQRRAALGELLRVKELIEETVGEADGRVTPGESLGEKSDADRAPSPVTDENLEQVPAPEVASPSTPPPPTVRRRRPPGVDPVPEEPPAKTRRTVEPESPTLAVPTVSDLDEVPPVSERAAAPPVNPLVRLLEEHAASEEPGEAPAGVFDFDEEE